MLIQQEQLTMLKKKRIYRYGIVIISCHKRVYKIKIYQLDLK